MQNSAFIYASSTEEQNMEKHYNIPKQVNKAHTFVAYRSFKKMKK